MKKDGQLAAGFSRGCDTAFAPIGWSLITTTSDGLVIQSGHNDKKMMWDSYYRATTKAKAQQFWSIRPPKRRERKIVQFTA